MTIETDNLIRQITMAPDLKSLKITECPLGAMAYLNTITGEVSFDKPAVERNVSLVFKTDAEEDFEKIYEIIYNFQDQIDNLEDLGFEIEEFSVSPNFFHYLGMALARGQSGTCWQLSDEFRSKGTFLGFKVNRERDQIESCIAKIKKPTF